MTIHCSHCGNPVSEQDTRCPYCGVPITPTPQQEIQQEEKKSNKTFIISLCVGIGLLIAVIILLLVLFLPKSQPEETTNPTQSDTSMVEESAPEPEPVVFENTTIKKVFYYKANTNRPLYATATYTLQWPVSAGTYDISVLQNELSKICFGKNYTDIQTLVNNAGKNKLPLEKSCGNSNGWNKVSAIPKNIEDSMDYTIDDFDDFPFDSPEFECKVSFVSCNEQTGLARYTVTVFTYNGGGTGAGAWTDEHNIYYDTKSSEIIGTNDFFVNGAQNKIIAKLKSNAILKDMDRSDINFNAITKLPTDFYIKGKNIYFVFEKYEIAAGCFNNVHLGLSLKSVKSLIEPAMLELFQLTDL